jgi:hypothetical protein
MYIYLCNYHSIQRYLNALIRQKHQLQVSFRHWSYHSAVILVLVTSWQISIDYTSSSLFCLDGMSQVNCQEVPGAITPVSPQLSALMQHLCYFLKPCDLQCSHIWQVKCQRCLCNKNMDTWKTGSMTHLKLYLHKYQSTIKH